MSSPGNVGLGRISLVCVPTIEQDRAIAFYESIGFEKRVDNTFGPGYRSVEVYLPHERVGLALAPPPPGTPFAPMNTGITLTSGDIDKTYAEFKALGADLDDEVLRMGGPVPPMFFFRDPSGHTLLVVEEH